MDKTLRTVIIVCICVITFSVFYYYVIYLPKEKEAERAETVKKEETARAEAERKEKAAREEERRKEFEQGQKVYQKKIDYYDCKKAVQEDTKSEWEEACERLKKGSNCALPLGLAESIERHLKEKVEQCYKERLQSP